jgi:hypothetical protein
MAARPQLQVCAAPLFDRQCTVRTLAVRVLHPDDASRCELQGEGREAALAVSPARGGADAGDGYGSPCTAASRPPTTVASGQPQTVAPLRLLVLDVRERRVLLEIEPEWTEDALRDALLKSHFDRTPAPPPQITSVHVEGKGFDMRLDARAMCKLLGGQASPVAVRVVFAELIAAAEPREVTANPQSRRSARRCQRRAERRRRPAGRPPAATG